MEREEEGEKGREIGGGEKDGGGTEREREKESHGGKERQLRRGVDASAGDCVQPTHILAHL